MLPRAMFFSQPVLSQSEVVTKAIDQRRPLRGINVVVLNHEICGDVHSDHFLRRDSSAEPLQTGPGQFVHPGHARLQVNWAFKFPVAGLAPLASEAVKPMRAKETARLF